MSNGAYVMARHILATVDMVTLISVPLAFGNSILIWLLEATILP